MALLGDDGRGYELARKLESCGVWRTWLGDTYYPSFVNSLASPSSWESFMRVDDSKSKTQIHLQLRARALLFDKASISLFLPNLNSSSVNISKLNPNYLQLHGDDVYFTHENSSQDGILKRENSAVSNTAPPSKNQLKSAYNPGSRYDESQFDILPQRFRSDELPEMWYDQFFEKYKVSRPYKVSLAQRELEKRSPEMMSAYLRVVEKHKRRRVPFQEDQYTGFGNSVLENTSSMHPNSVLDFNDSADGDIFLPEAMFSLNCVPEAAVPPINREKINKKLGFNGVLDTLPQVMIRSPVMIERLGIRPEYLGMDQGGSLHRGKNGSEGIKKCLGEEQALQLSQTTIARSLIAVGFEGATEVPLEAFSQLLGTHVCKLGHNLKVLADSYRNQCSAIELIKMFLQVAGYSNFGVLVELVKEGSRNVVQQTQQQVHGMQSQLQMQQQSPVRLTQQIPQQMNQQVVQPQNLQQQQLERIRRRQQSSPRPGMDTEKDRPLGQVKMETALEQPMDANALNAVSARPPQMQLRQQLNAMSNLHAQSSNQLRQLTSVQIPQMQTPQVQTPPMQTPQMQTANMGIVRAPPVKVEGFQELMGGDTSSKHESEESKLTSPASK